MTQRYSRAVTLSVGQADHASVADGALGTGLTIEM